MANISKLLPALSAFDLGYKAREAGKSVDDNVFNPGSKPSREWFYGYDIAETEMPNPLGDL